MTVESAENLTRNIAVPAEGLREFCIRSHIRKLAFFGSVLRSDFGPESDVDVLVEFERGHVPSLLRVVELEAELSRLFNRKVDLRTPEDLSRYFREDVVNTAAVAYAA